MMKTLKIEGTGGVKGDFLFNHLILTEGEIREVKSLDALAEEYDVDFISVEREGSINFYHVSDINNYDSINQNGLMYNESNDWIGDLGRGLYAVPQNDDIAIDNLQTYISEMVEDDEILIAEGTYTGKYNECVYGYGHEGYIVLKDNTNNINDLIECDVNDFLLDY